MFRIVLLSLLSVLYANATLADSGVEQAATLLEKTAPTISAPIVPPTPTAPVPTHDIRVQIVAQTSAVIGAPMSGRLEEFPLRDGDRFEKDAVIARFTCSEQQGALAHAQAVLTGKKALYVAQEKLHTLGTSSAMEYETAKALASEAAADTQTAQAIVSHCEVKAPFTGRVANISVRNQQFVQVGSPLIEILSDGNLELQMILPSSWLAWVKPGTKFDILVDETKKTYPAEITRLSGKMDAVSQSIKTYGKVIGDVPDLLPGMSGRALLSPPAEK